MNAVNSPDVQVLLKWGMRGSGDGEFRWPQDLVIESDGKVYVSEGGKDRMHVFDP